MTTFVYLRSGHIPTLREWREQQEQHRADELVEELLTDVRHRRDLDRIRCPELRLDDQT